MERNSQRKGVIHNSYADRLRPPTTTPKKAGKAMHGFDDFVSRLNALKEQSNLVIGGRASVDNSKSRPYGRLNFSQTPPLPAIYTAKQAKNGIFIITG